MSDLENENKPTGMFKVAPQPENGPQTVRRRILLTKRNAVILSFVLIIAGSFTAYRIFSEYEKTEKTNKTDKTSEIKIENTELFPELEQQIRGWWTLFDFVGNIGNFEPGKRRFVDYGIWLDTYRFEFFEDGTAYVNYPSEKISKPAYWNKDGDILNLLTDDHITVYAIKQIEGADYMFIKSSLPGFTADGSKIPEYCVLKKSRARYIEAGDDVREKDLRNYDLANAELFIKGLIFNEKTRFPKDVDPGYVMEQGKNPGLGVYSLHDRGITGIGVNIAIIDEPLITDHPEYSGKIAAYKDFSGGEPASIKGSAAVSLLAGKSSGTAPGARIYYAAVPPWNSFDARYYATALDWVTETNKSLPEGEKIKIVCLTPNPEDPLPWINVPEYLESFKRATQAGILVLDCTDEHGVVIGACKFGADREDVSLCKPISAYRIFIAPNHYEKIKEIYHEDEDEAREDMIRAPIGGRTMAETHREGEYLYQYDGKGNLSVAVSYITGVLAMGWQIKPELTSDEMIGAMFNTAYTDGQKNKYIDPTAFIEYLEKYAD